MSFKTTLGKALTRTDILTLTETTALGSLEHIIEHRFHDDSVVLLEDESEDQYGPFPLDQEIEVDDEGKSAITSIPEGGEPVTFIVYFERMVPLSASHLA